MTKITCAVFVLSLASPALAQTTPVTPAAAQAPAGLMDVIGQDGVSAPVLLKSKAPKFPKEARKARFNGRVLVDLIVETDGTPSHLQVLEGLGFGLDQSALDAVSAYQFQPSVRNGVPVRVEMHVEVHFKIF